MKGFFAVVLEALRGLDLASLKRPLVLLATADEESGMCGARSLARLERRLGRHALIGEPTGLRPVRLHKGITMEAIRIQGRSGHSSDPALGNNALEGLHRVMGELLAWRQSLQAQHRNPLFAVEVPTLNLGHVHGGDNPNRICGQCELHIDIRPLPGMSLEDLREALDRRRARWPRRAALRSNGGRCSRGCPPSRPLPRRRSCRRWNPSPAIPQARWPSPPRVPSSTPWEWRR